MNTHVTDELPGLLSGEAPRAVTLDAAAHLRACVDCQQELVSAVVAHASLTSAQRFAPEVVAGSTDEAGSASPLADLSAVFAQVRHQAAKPRRRRTRYLVGAAAAAAVVAGGSIALVATSGDTGSSAHAVRLAAYDHGTTDAKATLSDGQLRIDATSLPRLQGKGYEVWLTNGSRTSMKPVGWIGSDGTATLSVPTGLMNSYSDIEVSVQNVHAPSYLYSKVSVLRGEYA
jgi:Anti-sigma-K factor rskA